MLSPAEELGLAGAALDARIRRAVNHIPDATLARLSGRLAEDTRLNGIVYDHEGVSEPVRIMLRPLLVMPEQIAYLHHVCSRIVDALKRLPDLYFADAEVRALLRLAPAEEAWLRDAYEALKGGQNSLYGRLDAVCDFTGARWQDSLLFLEPNLSGVGGIQLGPVADSLLMRDIVPTIMATDPGLTIEPPRDQRDLFLQALLDHARSAGRRGTNICLVEPKYEAEGPNEQRALAEYVRSRHGIQVVHADPTELRLAGDEVWYEDTCIDVAYRDYEIRDLVELEGEIGRPLDAMRALFRQNRIVSTAGGDFDHKACFELLTDERLAARYFSNQERHLFRRHVLWTRLVAARTTSLPRGHGDLPRFIRDNREELVLKPNRGYGGEEVHLGALTDPAEWEQLVDRAVADAEDPDASWVVQSVANLPVHEFPVVDAEGRVHYEPFYAVMGFAPTDNGLAMLCRVSQKQVVNVAQRGGLASVLVGYKPESLRAPMRAAVPREQAVARLRERIRQLRDLHAVEAVLDWDEETYLPEGGREARGEQLATLETLQHDLLVDDALGDLIEEVAALAGDDPLLTAELAELRRIRRAELAVPRDLVGALAEASSHALDRWERARVDGRFPPYAKALDAMLPLLREYAQALARGGDPYDALLDDEEPGMTRAQLEPLFQALGARLKPLAAELAGRTARHARDLRGPFPADRQEAFCRALLADMGYDFTRGRTDRSSHPFTTAIDVNDVRLTLRFFPESPVSAVFATLHEGGHALYDQGFPERLQGTLLGDAPGMGLHESQSRLWENHVGRSRAFWEHYFPRLRAAFPESLAGLDTEAWVRAVNVVRPGVNRVESDEVTYNLHILMRYELELALLSGDLRVRDLPAAWNEASRRWLGVEPRNLREGCLQDVHWALGSFGYFPTYTLGNLYAAQLIEAYSAAADLDADLAAGRLTPLRDWLARSVYEHGSLHGTAEIVRRATGRPLDVEPFFRLLDSRSASLGS
jgi:carboxypeptidase Taq